jgi:phage protein D
MTALATSETAWAPALEVVVAGTGLAADVSKSITDVQVTLASDGMDQVSITLANPAPALRYTHTADALLFSEGSALIVRLGYLDDLTVLFDGEITGSTPSFPDAGVPTLGVEGVSRLHRLTAPPRRQVYKNLTDGQVAALVAERNRLAPDVTESPGATTYEQLVQFNLDDLAFLRARAQATGYELSAPGSALRFAPAGDDEPPRHTLVWGQPQLAFAPVPSVPLLRFQPRFTPLRTVTGVTVKGQHPVTRDALVGTAGPADAPAPPGRLSAGEVAAAFGADRSLTLENQPVLSLQEADTLARAVFRERSRRLVEATGAIVGAPEVQAGDTVTVLGVGWRFSGAYYVTTAVHSLGASGYRTTLTLRSGDVGALP